MQYAPSVSSSFYSLNFVILGLVLAVIEAVRDTELDAETGLT
jgi:hypothetical protein